MEVPETLGTERTELSIAQPPPKQWLDHPWTQWKNPKYLKHVWNHPPVVYCLDPHEMPKPPQWFCTCFWPTLPLFFTRTCWSSSPPPSKCFQDPNLRDCAWRSQLQPSWKPISVANCGSTVELPQEWRHQRFDPTILKHRQGNGTRFRARFWFGRLWEQLTIKCCRLRWACALDLQCISESALKCLAADRPAKWAMDRPFLGGSTWFEPGHLPSMMTSSGRDQNATLQTSSNQDMFPCWECNYRIHHFFGGESWPILTHLDPSWPLQDGSILTCLKHEALLLFQHESVETEAPRCWGSEVHTKNSQENQWIGLRENLQETMVFTIKYRGFL